MPAFMSSNLVDTAEFRSVRISRQTIEKVLDIVSVISNLCSWTLNNKTPTSPRSTTTAKANSPEASTSTNKVEPAALDSPGCSASSVNQNLALYTPQLAEIEMGFTIEEEAWLNNQVTLIAISGNEGGKENLPTLAKPSGLYGYLITATKKPDPAFPPDTGVLWSWPCII